MWSVRRHGSGRRARSSLYAGIIWLAVLAEGKYAGEGGNNSGADDEHGSQCAEAEAELVKR